MFWEEGDTHHRYLICIQDQCQMITRYHRQRRSLGTAFSSAAIRNLTPVFYDSAYKVRDATFFEYVWLNIVYSSKQLGMDCLVNREKQSSILVSGKIAHHNSTCRTNLTYRSLQDGQCCYG